MHESFTNNAKLLPFADVHNRVCSWVTGGRMWRRVQKIELLCWLSFFFFCCCCDDWMWTFIKSESLRCFHVAPCWTENNSTLNKASFSFSPRDDSVKRLMYFRVGPRPLDTHKLLVTLLAALWVRAGFMDVQPFTVVSPSSSSQHICM